MIRTIPEEGARSVARILRSVVFPEPLFPKRATASPRETERLRSANTQRGPILFPNPRISMTFSRIMDGWHTKNIAGKTALCYLRYRDASSLKLPPFRGIFPPVISPTKEEGLKRRFESLGIREEDLVEQFVRGSGRGGQKINKTSSTVLLIHRPSGIQVRCQASRSQADNRFLARRLLAQKLEAKILGKMSEEQRLREKMRRQKRRRSRRAKEKMLRGKHRRSETLKSRRVDTD